MKKKHEEKNLLTKRGIKILKRQGKSDRHSHKAGKNGRQKIRKDGIRVTKGTGHKPERSNGNPDTRKKEI